jgi:hypothetical protein
MVSSGLGTLSTVPLEPTARMLDDGATLPRSQADVKVLGRVADREDGLSPTCGPLGESNAATPGRSFVKTISVGPNACTAEHQANHGGIDQAE